MGLDLPDCLHPVVARCGSTDGAAIEAFLRPKLAGLTDPFLLPGLGAAVDRLLLAIDRRERVVLYGDYDVDGITSVAIVMRVLRSLGLEAQHFLPLRLEEGYGLSAEGVERCRRLHDPQLLLALDCGTSSVAQVAKLRAAGIDVLILDHHEPQNELPAANALVNPKLGSDYGYLCTAGLAFKLVHGLAKRRRPPDLDLKEILDLVALGTVADLVPIIGENRVLVFHGLQWLGNSRWIGVRKLLEVAGVRAPVDPVQVGFRLGPRLNAAGRLGIAQDALELLLTEDETRATQLAKALDAQNQERQALEQSTCEDALRQLAVSFSIDACSIVVGSVGWHPGVVGIVASRLARRFHRPTIVVGFDEDGIGKGSGRSIPGFSLVAALAECRSALLQFGGHEMAAGLAVAREQLPAFSQAFEAVARQRLSVEQLQPTLEIDAVLAGTDLGFRLIQGHQRLQPFGIGNPRPLFACLGVEPSCPPRSVGERHLAIALRHGSKSIRGLMFGAADQQLPPPPWDIACYLDVNSFQGTVELQLQIEAIRPAQ
ncbi:MAG: single-stranded-DNA-specific exonuclease RecJ [Verrucomicrobia bacterium]|nr:single-stranded-DNA-specific exonuclease RecJ [Verrucomicrobiota bacterium]